MIGNRIGRFEIVGQLGQGGMGVVWKARDAALDRVVALKMLRIQAPGGSLEKSQLVREARLASSLNHPNIVTIYEVGEHEGAIYVAMEYVEGQTLHQMIPGSGMAIDEVLRIGAQIAEGLAAAHAAGLVHRDLKPSNILVTAAGRVKILDFGLATSALRSENQGEERALDSLTELVTGTPAYVAPEQVAGRKADERSDLFSLGAVLYEMVSGRQAFRGKSPALTMAAVAREDPEPLERAPAEVTHLIARLLRKEPERRWQSALDLRAALEDLRVEVAERLPATEPGRGARRGWVWAIGVIAVLVLGVAIVRLSRPPETVPEPLVTQITTSAGLQRDPTFSADGNQIAYSWNGPDGRNFDIYVQAVSGGERIRITTDPLADEAPRWSPNGDRIAFTRVQDSNRKSIYTAGPLGGAERKIYDLPFLPMVDQTSYFCWTQDGRYLIVSGRTQVDGRGRLMAVNVESGEQVPLSREGDYFGSEPALSPDGRWLAFIREGERYRLHIAPFDPEKVELGEARLVVEDDRSLDNPVWTRDGKHLIVTDDRSGGESRLLRVSAHGGGPMHLIEYAGSPSMQAAFSPRGDRMAFARSYTDTNIWRLPLKGRKASRAPEPFIVSSFLEMQPEWSPDGARVAFESTRSGMNRVWVADRNGGVLFQLGAGREHTGSPAWSPDGQWIAYDTFHPEHFLNVAPAEGGATRVVTRERFYSPRWSIDGKSLLVSRGSPPQTEFFRLPWDGGPGERLGGPGRYARPSADGQWIYFELQTSRVTSDVYRLRTPGGGSAEPTPLATGVIPRTWDLQEGWLWFVRAGANSNEAQLVARDPKSLTEVTVHTFHRPATRGLSIARDGSSALYVQMDGRGSNVMLMENFR